VEVGRGQGDRSGTRNSFEFLVLIGPGLEEEKRIPQQET